METEQSQYLVPSDSIKDVVDVEEEPALVVDPTNRHCVVLRYRALALTIEDLSRPLIRTAGLSFDPVLRVPERTVYASSVSLKRIFGAQDGSMMFPEVDIHFKKKYEGFRYFSWHPKGHRFIFCGMVNRDTPLELLMVTFNPAKPLKEQEPLLAEPIVEELGLQFNSITNRPTWFAGDGGAILCYCVPKDIGPPPSVEDNRIPRGPIIKENNSTKSAPARTYQRLIKSKQDELLFEYYTKSDLVALFVDGKESKLVQHVTLSSPGGEMIRSALLSPNGKHLLVSITQRPFSWLLPYSKFPKRIEVWTLTRALSMAPPPGTHVKSIAKHPDYPERAKVQDIPFLIPNEDYRPVEFTHEKSIGPAWADKDVAEIPKAQLASRLSHHGQIFFDPSNNGRPINPVGRTGMTGRGLLGKWGPNHAADAIVTRYNSEGKLQMVAIKRRDTGEWAIPGGMVDPGETVPMTLRREFMEEAAANLSSNSEEKLARLFQDGFEIYKGYVDDPRNTDNSWMESVFVHFHCFDKELAEGLPLEAGDDATSVQWLDIDESVPEFANLYGSHKAMVLAAKNRLEGNHCILPAFATELTVSERQLVCNLPDQEGMVISFDACPPGPRGFAWHWNEPNRIRFVHALDEGNPKLKDVEYRDALYLLQYPYHLVSEPSQQDTFSIDGNLLVKEIIKTKTRISSVKWGRIGAKFDAIVSERWRKNRWTRSWIIKEGLPPKLLYDRSFDDAYSSPGSMLTHMDSNGIYAIQQDEDMTYVDIVGVGASAVGNRPFYDRLYIDEKLEFCKERIWRCTHDKTVKPADLDLAQEPKQTGPPLERQVPVYEYPEEIVHIGKTQWILLRRESNDTPPDYFWVDLGNEGKEYRITNTAHPQPALIGVKKQLIRYKRADGLELTGDLYLPRDYNPETESPRPCLLWAYPREFKQAKTAGQMKQSPHRFTRTSWRQPIPWVAKGWVVFGFSCPIVGEGEDTEPNDTFVEQVQMNARASVDFLVKNGYGKYNGMACGGHSYGAFMTAHLLAHTNCFRAGISRSGCYIRALTPFGFQSEERTYWESTETYTTLSPFTHAPKIAKGSGKLLLIHGTDDENSGTFPMQSERLYDALKGHGAITKLVLLPKEGHGYAAKESILHCLAEQESWLDRHVVENFDNDEPIEPNDKRAQTNHNRIRVQALMATTTLAFILIAKLRASL